MLEYMFGICQNGTEVICINDDMVTKVVIKKATTRDQVIIEGEASIKTSKATPVDIMRLRQTHTECGYEEFVRQLELVGHMSRSVAHKNHIN